MHLVPEQAEEFGELVFQILWNFIHKFPIVNIAFYGQLREIFRTRSQLKIQFSDGLSEMCVLFKLL